MMTNKNNKKIATGFFVGDLKGKKQLLQITVNDLKVFNQLFLNVELQKRGVIKVDIIDFDFAIKVLTQLKNKYNDKRI